MLEPTPTLKTMESILESGDEFGHLFKLLTGAEPMEWQRRLFVRLGAGSPPPELRIPEGLGVESVIAIWLIARTVAPARVPCRIVWTYPKGVTLDAATDLATAMLDRLPPDAPEMRYAIRSYRGEHGGTPWLSIDPSTPAVIVGSTDEIGRAMGFQAQRSTLAQKPHAAGLLGVDAYHVLQAGIFPETAYRAWMDAVVKENEQSLRPMWYSVVTEPGRD